VEVGLGLHPNGGIACVTRRQLEPGDVHNIEVLGEAGQGKRRSLDEHATEGPSYKGNSHIACPFYCAQGRHGKPPQDLLRPVSGLVAGLPDVLRSGNRISVRRGT